jgi:hypothetical protein
MGCLGVLRSSEVFSLGVYNGGALEVTPCLKLKAKRPLNLGTPMVEVTLKK